MAILDTLKEVVFKETADAGKVCLITWDKGSVTGLITVLVPQAAFDRARGRAVLRAVRVKISQASKIEIVQVAPALVNYPQASYYLVRAKFTI